MSFCPNCGAQIDAADKFCRNCGTPMQASGAAPVNDVEPTHNLIFNCISDHPNSYARIGITGYLDVTVRANTSVPVKIPQGVYQMHFGVHRGHGFTISSSNSNYSYTIPIGQGVRTVTIRIGRAANRIEF